jgi:hypothetical protein
MKDSLPDFSGKVVLVYHTGTRDPQHTSVIKNSSFELQGNRVFLCGEPIEGDTPNDWIVGCKICLAWDTVETYIVFDSSHDYHARSERGRAMTKVQ